MNKSRECDSLKIKEKQDKQKINELLVLTNAIEEKIII